MFILKGWLKHTKDIIKPLKITILSISFLAVVFFVKYKPVYTVTVDGDTLGYVKEKTDLESELTKYINHREGTIALIDIENMPEYSFELVSRSTKTSEADILDTIEQTAIITYKTYAITVNGETINEVDTEAEAQEIISNLQADLKEGVEFELGMAEIYKTEQTSVSEETALSQLNEIKLAKTTAYEEEQARMEAERIAAEEAAKAEAAKKAAAYSSYSSVATSTGSGNINGISISNPLKISYLVTSRFGEVSSRRSSTHTGLDLAVSLGTPIYPISEGTVTFAGWQGSYGNMIIVDHGDGIQSWYAHCNSLLVSVRRYSYNRYKYCNCW
jgi:murein DD-endopeptidase MepM/ murein hydrolase activator NlpD